MPNLETLISLSKFEGIDSSTNDVDQTSNSAINAPNANPFRDRMALATARGRVNITTLAEGLIIVGMAQAAISGTVRAIYFSVLGASNNYIVSLNPETLGQTVIETVATSVKLWTQAFQYGIPLYCNDGTQIRGNNGAAPFKVYQWQYFQQINVSGGLFSAGPGTGTNMGIGQYSYTFTSVITFPDGTTQETSPSKYTVSGALFASPFAPLAAPGSLLIDFFVGGVTPAQWSGSLADGSTYTTNLYRQSTNQPTWLFVANLTGNAAYNDNNSDASLLANQQLDLYRDPPPVTQNDLFTTGATYGVIFEYKDRAWNFVIVQSGITNNLPQCQLWYSDFGVPYSFNTVYSVLLVGNGDTALNPVYGGYGDSPATAVVLPSAVLLFKYKSLFVLWGNDQTTFLVQGIGTYEIVAPASAADCDGVGMWLDAMGVHQCDGFSKPEYIGEDIRLSLDAIPRSDWASAVGWYANRSYYLSFPATGVTYIYYLTAKKWRQLPYGTNIAFAQPGYQPPASLGVGSQVFNFICAARPGTVIIDAWDAAETDLGNQITATWQGPLQDSGKAWGEKNYRVVGLSAPIQPGCTAVVNLTVFDSGVTGSATPSVIRFPNSGSIDLSAKTWHVFPVPQNQQKGYLAQVQVTITNAANATTFCEIFGVYVGGTIDREWVIPN